MKLPKMNVRFPKTHMILGGVLLVLALLRATGAAGNVTLPSPELSTPAEAAAEAALVTDTGLCADEVTLQHGQTLGWLADYCGIPVEALMHLNGKDRPIVFVGERIRIR